MLHENAKQRLRRMLPETYDIEWFDELQDEYVSTTVELGHRQLTWDTDDSPTPKPAVYLNFDPSSVPRGDLGHVFKEGVYKREHPSDDSVAYTKFSAKPMTGTLNVTVVTDADEFDDSTGGVIPKRVVADNIAMQVFQVLEFEDGDLDEQGTTPSGVDMRYAWPLFLRGISRDGIVDTSRMLDEQSVQRRHMQYRVDYAYFHEEEVPATAAIEYDFKLDANRDGEFTTRYEDERVVFYEYDPNA